MIEELLYEIDEILSKYKLHIGNNIDYLAYLINLKYLCEINVYSFEDVIISDKVYPLNRETQYIEKDDDDIKFPINRLLINVKDITSKELLLEFLKYLKKPLYIHEDNDSIAYFNTERSLYEYYNSDGNATYIMKKPEYFEILKAFDKILNINNNYILFNDIKDNIAKYHYDYIYIYDDTLRFSKYSNNLLDTIHSFLEVSDNIVLIARYSKISNFREGRFLVRFMNTIILDDKKAIIHFRKKRAADEISIISTNNIQSNDELLSIIKLNKEEKGVLLKVFDQDIRDNNYRIGFNLYQLEKTSKIKDINKIVDENTKYLERLNRINEIVELEINKLLNK